MKIRSSERKRLLSQVERADGCWEWRGRKVRGYGVMNVHRGDRATKYVRYTMLRVHRYMYSEFVGPIPNGALVCHRCDNRSCVNPDHLFVGTPADNSRDMVRKGRQARGVRNSQSKLTPGDVRAIRASPLSLRAIADRYGMSPSQMHRIRAGLSWTHVS